MESTALLIGSAEYDPHRPHRGVARRDRSPRESPSEHGNVAGNSGLRSIAPKRGIQTPVAKAARKFIPLHAWMKGDLDNMERLMRRKGIDVFEVYAYKEVDGSTGAYSNGIHDVLEKIDAFFQQSGKTHFILYFSGHGAEDGSWSIPVTVKKSSPNSSLDSSTSSPPASPVDLSPISPTMPLLVHAEVHLEDHGSGKAEDKPASVKASINPLWKPPITMQFYDLVEYEDVMELWEKSKAGRRGRRLMIILDACHSGRWVQKASGVVERSRTDLDSVSIEKPKGTTRREPPIKPDVCIQAACGPSERPMIASNQLSSLFTRAFVAAQSRSPFERAVLTLLDHVFVLNWVSILFSPNNFSPVTYGHPFGGIKLYDSFDDMYLT